MSLLTKGDIALVPKLPKITEFTKVTEIPKIWLYIKPGEKTISTKLVFPQIKRSRLSNSPMKNRSLVPIRFSNSLLGLTKNSRRYLFVSKLDYPVQFQLPTTRCEFTPAIINNKDIKKKNIKSD